MASAPLIGLVLGLALVGLLEYRDSSFKSGEDVFRALTLPVLAMVPVMPSQLEQQTQRRRTLALDGASIALFMGAGIVLLLWRIQA